MPYIKEEDRVALLAKERPPSVAGELNFLFTVLSLEYLQANGLNYQHINDIIGALEGCKLELYRRLVVGYEDTKIESNGDVYPEEWPG